VVEQSDSGRVLVLGNSEIANALVLFNTKLLDKGRDAFSIHRLARVFPSEAELEAFHESRMKELGIVCDIRRFVDARAEFFASKKILLKHGAIGSLQHIRNTLLAHHLEEREAPLTATYFQLIEVTEALMHLVEVAGYSIGEPRRLFPDFTKRAEDETKLFYSILPPLAAEERK
jgi:hypothetical protein